MKRGKNVLWIIKAAFIVLAGVGLAKLMNQSLFALSIIEMGMYFSVLLCGYRYGAGSGAVVGTACGIIQTIRQEEIALLGVFCLLGVLAGMFRSLGKSASSLGFAAGAVGVGILYSQSLIQNSMLEIALAVIVFLILPAELTRSDEEPQPVTGIDEEERNKEGLLVKRVGEISQSLGQVSKSFSTYEKQQDSYQKLKNWGKFPEDGDTLWKTRFLESREAVASQFGEMEHILYDLKREWEETEDITKKMENVITNALKIKHVRAEKLMVLEYGNNRQEVYVSAVTDNGRCVTTKEVADMLGRKTDKRWRPADDCKSIIGKEPCDIRLIEDTGYMMLHGVARSTKWGEAISGDHFTFVSLPKGQAMMCLADGMGSGHMASIESETVVELAEQLLETGFTAERAVKLINSVLLMNSDEQKPTTLDLIVIDLYSATCRLVKLGAMPTFIRRRDKVIKIEEDTLPIGVFDKVDFAPVEFQLEDDDMIIMLTDGILDSFPDTDKEMVMQEVINCIQDPNPSEVADKILQFALAQNNFAKDDMTVLAAGIWER